MRSIHEVSIVLTVILVGCAVPMSAQTCGVEPPTPVMSDCEHPKSACICNRDHECAWQWASAGDMDAVKNSDDEFGRRIGEELIGQPIMTALINRGVKKYCKAHPENRFTGTMPDGKVVRRETCPAKDNP